MQVRVYLYEDLMDAPASVLRDVFGFLDVDEEFLPDMSFKHNASGVPKNKRLHAFLTKPGRIKTVVRPIVPAGIRKRAAIGLKSRNLRRPHDPLRRCDGG